MITEIGIASLIGIMSWLIGAWIHRLPISETIQIPFWLARLFGSQTSRVDPKMFSIQLMGLGIMVWLVFIIFIDPHHEQREIIFPGCIMIIVITSVTSIILSRLAEKG